VAFPSNVEVDDITGEVTKELDDADLLQNRPPFQRALVISGNQIIILFILAMHIVYYIVKCCYVNVIFHLLSSFYCLCSFLFILSFIIYHLSFYFLFSDILSMYHIIL
jgi:hypothetical protein